MSTRSRIVAYGSAGAVAVIGGICAAVVPGLTGQLLAFVLISVGLGAAVLLVFYEVGLSEDKERAAEQHVERSFQARGRRPTHGRACAREDRGGFANRTAVTGMPAVSSNNEN